MTMGEKTNEIHERYTWEPLVHGGPILPVGVSDRQPGTPGSPSCSSRSRGRTAATAAEDHGAAVARLDGRAGGVWARCPFRGSRSRLPRFGAGAARPPRRPPSPAGVAGLRPPQHARMRQLRRSCANRQRPGRPAPGRSRSPAGPGGRRAPARRPKPPAAPGPRAGRAGCASTACTSWRSCGGSPAGATVRPSPLTSVVTTGRTVKRGSRAQAHDGPKSSAGA